MKILHTADLHLGKKLSGRDRLDEQQAALDEIKEIARAENVDVILACGDIFDTSVPSASAEELFYKSAVALSAAGAVFVAIAGNHDDAQRLKAPAGLAKPLDIFLVGGYDNSGYTKKGVTGGNGFLKIERGGETLNLALMPYPQHTRLAEDKNKDTPYATLVKDRLYKCAECFDEKQINVLAAHLFIDGAAKDKSDLTDERELGTAALLPKSIFPDADYTALGHIHKPLTVSKSRNIYYSGSMLGYSFDDLNEKSVIIAEIKTEGGVKNTTVKRVPLKSAKKLIKAECSSFEQAEEILAINGTALVYLTYAGERPLKAGELTALKRHAALIMIENKYREERQIKKFSARTDRELFCDFYKAKNRTEKEPDDGLTDMFLSVLNGEEQL